MTRDIAKRIAKLESPTAEVRRMIVVEIFTGETEAESLAAAAVTPTPTDCLVFIQRFSGQPATRTATITPLRP